MLQTFVRGAGVACALVVLLVGTPVHAAYTDPVVEGAFTVKMMPFATIPSGDGAPQDLTSANDGSGRLFVSTRNGRIRTLDANGNLSGTTFLNLTNSPPGVSMFLNGEGGFSALQFAPNYLTSGKFYTCTTETFNAASTVHFSHPEMLPNSGGITPSNHIVIREWKSSGSAPYSNATTADASSTRVVMRINHPQNNHQGGSMRFGPDGFLYIGLGDGGSGDDYSGTFTSGTDGHTNFNAATGIGGNGQDPSVVLGKLLRIDPGATGTPNTGSISANGEYGIPPTNPFVGQAGKLGEVYAYGLRNPYRLSFDSTNGKLYVGDVGQDQREEVDEITSGGNYGWPIREGSIGNSPWTTPGGFSSIAPLAEYRNQTNTTLGGGNSIIGGFIYRGSLMPALVGKYIFGDLDGANSGATIGRIFYSDLANGQTFELKYDLANGGASPTSITGELYGFGEDTNHELYAMFNNGQILRFVPEPGSLCLIALAPFVLGRRRTR